MSDWIYTDEALVETAKQTLWALPCTANWVRTHRAACSSYMKMASPLLSFWQAPPNPAHRVLVLTGPMMGVGSPAGLMMSALE